MKVLKLATAFVFLAGVFCGAEEPAAEKASPGVIPAVAFEEIGEAEMESFIAALPDVEAVLNEAGFAPEEQEGDEIADAITRVMTAMEQVAGLEAALAQHDTDWEEFSGTMYKVMATSVALGFDMVLAMTEGMAADDPEMQAELDKARTFCERVPEANKEMVMENMARLEALGVN